MNYLLDTNTCIQYLNGRSPNLKQRLEKTPAKEIVVCSIVKAELFFGSMKSVNPRRSLATQKKFLDQFDSLPFDDQSAEIYGQIRAQLESQGTPIGPTDLLIAAIALANQVTLVTHNTREFSRVTGLQIEDWET
ncbi:MAG: type II toxin-antitoxin system tRNA(fMet)-specific endonuclease VapC [Blastocatellia bacterium]